MELVSRDRIAKRTLMNASNSGSVVANVAHVSTHAVPTGEKNLHFVMPTISQLFYDFSCKCGQYGVCGRNCHLEDPCIHDVCANGGTCVENCSEVADYHCNCTSQFTGKNCTEEVSRKRLVFAIFSLLFFLKLVLGDLN